MSNVISTYILWGIVPLGWPVVANENLWNWSEINSTLPGCSVESFLCPGRLTGSVRMQTSEFGATQAY
ncbi:hypothetical protein N7478_013259 [Penicillium angulare]|uniref:uncharacterized protein n=1 Tax=Penicillium angulare TaxID=116970 RepID=UPI00254244FF|nr:uncharacterized protein N7478_013259 [Penicillium angulare]KAJ5257155.1 hypothetical protein N7478_013259 [Penicillium angulare]